MTERDKELAVEILNTLFPNYSLLADEKGESWMVGVVAQILAEERKSVIKKMEALQLRFESDIDGEDTRFHGLQEAINILETNHD